MAAREAFERGRIGAFALQRMGAFSVDREGGGDVAPIRMAPNVQVFLCLPVRINFMVGCKVKCRM
jgi:hypothetical protein